MPGSAVTGGGVGSVRLIMGWDVGGSGSAATNAGDAGKRVHIEFTYLGPDAGLAIRVRDEGCGFDPDALRDPLSPENLLKPSGRGIFLIRSFTDELELRRAPEGGMEIIMVKRPQPVRS